MSQMIAQSLGKTFKEKHFRRILNLVPGFYIHKWQMKKGKMELMIDIPQNVNELLEDENLDAAPSETAL